MPLDAQAKTLLASLKKDFEADGCDLSKCEQQLSQLKLLLFSNLHSLRDPAGGAAKEERQVTQEALELACFLSIRRKDSIGFERHVSQLKMYYNDGQKSEANSQKYVILGLYLLHLLASDRIGDFHTELELIPVEDYENSYIKRPIQLERYLMEGNYAKVLEAQKDMPKMYYAYFMDRLEEMVRHKVGASLERSYDHVPAQTAASMLILKDVAALQEYTVKENERKAREEEEDDPMGDMTPSLTRRAPLRNVRWEVKSDKLFFVKTEEKRLTLQGMDLVSRMMNTIGYATDLERIV